MMSSSSSSATVRVEKATSDLLIGPDWTMNMDICDSINSSHWDAKDVIKAVKKRLQHKNPKVQLLALTLLETMVKNCGDYVHFQITEKNILQEMIKIVKKKTDMQVRYKILVLIDSWQEAFGGPGGKYPQYFWAYGELKRSGVVFPQRSLNAAPIFTPPVTHSTLRHAQPAYGMPSNSSKRLDEAMAAETEYLSINSMRNVLDLLADMLQVVNPSDLVSLKDEVIRDLVNTCRSNQKKLMQMLTTTGDEELLRQGLELNDNLQFVLAKHDAIASGSPLPIQVTNVNHQSVDASDSSLKPTEVNEPSQVPIANLSASVVATTKGQVEEEEDEEDDFALLARRHSKTRSTTSQDTCTGTTSNDGRSAIPADSAPVPSNALALSDPPASARTTKDQDMIEDLLSITLSTPTTAGCPQTPHTPPAASSQNIHQAPVSPSTRGYPYTSQTYSGNEGQVPLNSYVVPWAQHQSQPQVQPQTQYHQYSSSYVPPPWASTPGYISNQNHSSTTPYMHSTPSPNPAAYYAPVLGAGLSQHLNYIPARESNGLPTNGEPRIMNSALSSSPRTANPGGQKAFVPSYRLFEDLNVLGNEEGKIRAVSSTSPSMSGAPTQSMVGGRK